MRFELTHPYRCPPQNGASTNFATRAFLVLCTKKGCAEERLELSRDNSQQLLRPQRLLILY